MIYSSSFYTGLKPDPLLKVSEWADRNRQLSTIASSEPGVITSYSIHYTKLYDSSSSVK